jgi:transcriptional regulator with XRE-family HTH domain
MGQKDYADHWDRALIAGIKKERQAQGISQIDLAERMSELGYKFHQATVYKIENGDRKVTASEAHGLAEIFDVEIDHLFAWESASVGPEAMRKLLHSQTDNVLQLLFKLDDDARRLRTAHKALTETISKASSAGLTDSKLHGDPGVDVVEFYWPVVSLAAHNELLWRLRHEVWTDEFAWFASSFGGVAELGDEDWYGEH